MSNHPSENTKGRLLRRALAGILTLALMLGLLPASVFTAHAASWADSYVQTLVDWGVMRGDIGGNMAPDRSITRAEFVTMMNRAYGYQKLGGHPFTDVRVRDWYNEDIDIAYNIGYFKGTSETTASPNDSLTREQAAVLLARNMMLQETVGETLGFSDTRRLSDWSRGLVGAAAANGIISGYEDGSFQPMRNITRGEVAAMLVRAIGTPIQEGGDHALGNVYGNVTVNTSGVKLRDGVIAGNLYLTGGIDLGDVLLENVTVLGEIIVSGGGESNSSQSSIVLRNVVADSMVVDSIGDQFVTIRAEGNTDIPTTTVRTNAYVDDSSLPGYGLSYIELDGENGALYQLAGNIKEVVNKTPGSSLQVVQGVADKVTVDEEAAGSNVLVDGDAQVGDLNLDTGTNVTGTGDIKNLNVGSAGSTVEQLPDKIVIRPGIEANVGGSNMNSTQGAESSADPKLLAGYPAVRKIAPNSAELVFRTNKPGTIYWAVSAVADGSVSEEDLLEPPVYGNKVLASGKISATAANTDYTAAVNRLTSAGSYYVTAMLVDGRDQHSPIKVTSFSTPDDTVPAFASGYPYMSKTTCETAQVTVMTTKSCLLYYALLPSGAAAPTPAELKAAAVTGNLGYGSQSVTKNVTTPINVNRVPLEEKTTYDLYLWLTDHDGAKSMARPQKLTFTTPDETPPKVTNIQQTFPTTPANQADRIVNMAYTMDEPGNLVWAIVTDSEFNADNKTFLQWDDVTPNAGDETRGTLKFLTDGGETDAAKLLAAKVKLESGTGAIQSGSTARSPFNITNLLTQNTHTSIYYVYYMGKDTTGNYSEDIKYIRVNTEDRTPPEFISQTFTPVPDEENSPLASSSISLTFSENLQGGTDGKAMFLDLYTRVESARRAYRSSPDDMADGSRGPNGQAYDTARKELGDALMEHFTMWRQPATGEPEEVPVRTSDKQTGEWTVDWRNAQIRMVDGQFVITLPTIGNSDKEHTEEKRESALKLDSGETYYIQVSELYDLAVSPNGLNYQNQQIWGTPRRNLPRFTTMDVQVLLTDGDEPQIKNAVTKDGAAIVSNGVVDTAFANANNDPRRIDYHFKMRPQDVDRVADDLYWDMLLRFNHNVSITIYSRQINDRGQPVSDTGAVLDAANAPWTLESKQNANGSIQPLTLPRGNFRSLSYFVWDKTPDYAKVNEMLTTVGANTDYRKEFAIHLDSLEGDPNYAAWMEDPVTMRVSVVAGLRSQLNPLNDANDQRYEDNTGANKARAIETPLGYTKSQSFSQQGMPEIKTVPNISISDESADITLALDRPGRVYYLVIPVSDLYAAGSSTRLDGNELTEDVVSQVRTNYFCPLPFSDVQGSGNSTPTLGELPLMQGDPDRSNYSTSGTYDENTGTWSGDPQTNPKGKRIYAPDFTYFTGNRQYGEWGVIKDVTRDSTGDGDAIPINLENLQSNKVYLLCLLPSNLSSQPDDTSKIVCYRFTTNMEEIPKLQLSGGNMPTINARETNAHDAYLTFFLVAQGKESGGGEFSRLFSQIANTEEFNNSPYISAADKTKMTVLEAMGTLCFGANRTYLGTAFDLYAKDTEKPTYTTLIQAGMQGYGTNPDIKWAQLDQQMNRQNSYSRDLACGNYIEGGQAYTLIAMARKDLTSNAYSYAAIFPVQKREDKPPMLEAAYLSGSVTQMAADKDGKSTGVGSAELVLDFSDFLYHWDSGKMTDPEPIDNCLSTAHTTNPVKVGNVNYWSLGGVGASTATIQIKGDADHPSTPSPIRSIRLGITNLSKNSTATISFPNYTIVGQNRAGTGRSILRITVRAVNSGTAEDPTWVPQITQTSITGWTEGTDWNQTIVQP